MIFWPTWDSRANPPDESAEVDVDGRTAWWTAGAPLPEQAPRGAVPADDGLGVYKQDGAQQVPPASGQGTYEPPIESAPARAFDLAADDDELLAED